MTQFNPDFLLKDELTYEALLRGLSFSNVTVAELRKTLRENKPDQPSLLKCINDYTSRLSVLDFNSEKETCYRKYTELTSYAQTLRDEKSDVYKRQYQQCVPNHYSEILNLLSTRAEADTDVDKYAIHANRFAK